MDFQLATIFNHQILRYAGFDCLIGTDFQHQRQQQVIVTRPLAATQDGLTKVPN
jgi:hypothetical protein